MHELARSTTAFAQVPLARWSNVGAAPLVCGRGRFMVPGLDDLSALQAVRDLLTLALARGVSRETWIADAPRLRGAGAWQCHLAGLTLGRAFGYALRASGARVQLVTFAHPSAPRLLPFLT